MHVCPWWLGYFLINPVRKWYQDPKKILEPYVSDGMTVLEPGPGMGFFTLELARRVGPSGRVITVDVQPKMLNKLHSRAAKAGMSERLDIRLVPRDGGMGVGDLKGKVDFVLAFAMVHELPDRKLFFREVATALKTGGRLLIAEPRGHVKWGQFEETLREAESFGLKILNRPEIAKSHSALLAG
jgi:ubiquinone/menaquinone biosynthesis C-methylase UbiE